MPSEGLADLNGGSVAMPSVTLTDKELVLLDGQCSEKVQSEVNLAKDRLEAASRLPDLSEAEAAFISDAVNEAKTNGVLVKRWTKVRHCKLCNSSAGYAKYTRSSRYHRKGQTDHSKPLYLSGVELADRFVVMTGYPTLGCCNNCYSKLQPILKDQLSGVQAKLPEELRGETTYDKKDNMECTKCGWTGHEGEMGMLQAIMGGEYPGQCPKCDAQNLPFGRNYIEIRKGFTIVPK